MAAVAATPGGIDGEGSAGDRVGSLDAAWVFAIRCCSASASDGGAESFSSQSSYWNALLPPTPAEPGGDSLSGASRRRTTASKSSGCCIGPALGDDVGVALDLLLKKRIVLCFFPWEAFEKPCCVQHNPTKDRFEII